MNTEDFPFKVYDPEPEAKKLLQGWDSLTVVKGLLNQLRAAEQTNAINSEVRADQLKQRDETIKELIKGLQGLNNLFYAGYTLRPNDIDPLIDKARKLLTE